MAYTSRYPLRCEVEEANTMRLANLPPPAHTYDSLDVAGHDVRGKPISPQQAQKLLDKLVVLKSVTLKVVLYIHAGWCRG